MQRKSRIIGNKLSLFFLPVISGIHIHLSTKKDKKRSLLLRIFSAFFVFLYQADRKPIRRENRRRVCAQWLRPHWKAGWIEWQHATNTNRGCASSLYGCRAERSRCGSANNSCALTGVQSTENRIKWSRKPRDKEHEPRVLMRTVTSFTQRADLN